MYHSNPLSSYDVFPVCHHINLPMCTSISVFKFPLFIRTPVIVYKRPTLITSFELDYFHKDHIFKYGPMIRCWGLGLYHSFSGGFPSGSPGEGNSNLLQHSCLENPMDRRTWRAPVHGSQRVGHAWVTNTHFTSLVNQMVNNLPEMQETWVRFLGREDPLEKEMAAHSSILAWRIPQMEEPGGLQSMGSQRVRHNWATNAFTFHFLHLFSERCNSAHSSTS